MLNNYLKIAWRNLLRNKSYTFINILGLSIGIACCMLILLWVTDEISYDKWNEKADRTYRVAAEINFGGSHRHMAVSPSPLAQTLRQEFPEIETSVRFWNAGSALVKKDVQNFKEENIIYTDSTLFDVFSLELIKGSPKEALATPNSMVVNETIARRYFGDEEPMGQTLTINNNEKFTVRGVIKDMPKNSHFTQDIFLSMTGRPHESDGIWLSHNFFTYYVLKKGIDNIAFEQKVFPLLLEKFIAPQTMILAGMSYEDLTNSGAFIRYYFQPLTDIHLKSNLNIEMGPNGSVQYLRIFLAAALFILLIACVNFMNLSTAQSSMRAKEIGIRKVMGSMRKNLINQFLSESMLLVAIALGFGLIIAQLALPFYNELAEKELALPFGNPFFWMALVGGGLIVGLISGSYPAFYLSGFKPIQTLKGKIFDKKSNLNLRNSLVVFQFFIAVLLIEGTIVIQQQMNFIQNKNLGFERDQVLVIDDAYALDSKLKTYKDELLKNPEIISASASSFLPVPSSRSDSPLCKTSGFNENDCISIQLWDIDEDYIPTLGMEILEGRNFTKNMPTDSNAVILNEKAVQLFGLENPVGKLIYGSNRFQNDGDAFATPYTIIGVVKDFHFASLRENIGALSFFLAPSSGYISLKLHSENAQSVIATAEKTWNSMAPDQPFAYQFLDESFDRMYRSETRISKIISIFSGMSIFIACLGLFGLATFTTQRRTKEIGIRKVLGATPFNILRLLSKDFLVLVAISFTIATPLAWYGMKNWLNDFSYRIEIEWWIFIMAGIISLAIALITISSQSIRAAIENPVQSLRSE